MLKGSGQKELNRGQLYFKRTATFGNKSVKDEWDQIFGYQTGKEMFPDEARQVPSSARAWYRRMGNKDPGRGCDLEHCLLSRGLPTQTTRTPHFQKNGPDVSSTGNLPARQPSR